MKVPRSLFLFRLTLSILFLACIGSRGTYSKFSTAAQDPHDFPNVHIMLLGTTDLHGHIEPLDYYTNKPAQLGLAKIATLIRRVRTEQPNVLLLDSGDTIQGTPLAYYFAHKDTDQANPMMLAMNTLEYDSSWKRCWPSSPSRRTGGIDCARPI